MKMSYRSVRVYLLPLIIILMHLNCFLRLCLSTVDVHLILACPLSHPNEYNSMRECTTIETEAASAKSKHLRPDLWASGTMCLSIGHCLSLLTSELSALHFAVV